MNANKWRKRYERQVEVNNLLSDRLRSTRNWATQALSLARKKIDAQRETLTAFQARIIELEGQMADELDE